MRLGPFRRNYKWYSNDTWSYSWGLGIRVLQTQWLGRRISVTDIKWLQRKLHGEFKDFNMCTLQETCFYKYMLGGATAESAGCISSLKTVHIQPLMLMMQNNFQTLILSQCHSISIRLLYLLVTSRSVHLNRQCLLKKTELGW